MAKKGSPTTRHCQHDDRRFLQRICGIHDNGAFDLGLAHVVHDGHVGRTKEICSKVVCGILRRNFVVGRAFVVDLSSQEDFFVESPFRFLDEASVIRLHIGRLHNWRNIVGQQSTGKCVHILEGTLGRIVRKTTKMRLL